jgi:integrase
VALARAFARASSSACTGATWTSRPGRSPSRAPWCGSPARAYRTSIRRPHPSAATIPLAPAAITALRAHRARQLEQRFAVRDAWQDSGYVFTTALGTPISASNLLRRSFYPLCSRAGIPTRPGLRFHDLRHSCGSLLIAEGVKPKLVQAILRHSKLSTTMDLYVHAYDEDLRGAVASLDRALGS